MTMIQFGSPVQRGRRFTTAPRDPMRDAAGGPGIAGDPPRLRSRG